MVIKVKDVMATDVVTIDCGAALLDALKLMMERGVKSLVIPPRSDSDAFGILTFTDIAKKVLPGEERLEMLNVYDLMTKPCLCVFEDWNIRYAAKMLTDMNISRAIVSDGKTLQGIISLFDIVKSLSEKIPR